MLKGKNVLVTGSTGFVGTNLLFKLLSLGANIRGTIHNKPAFIGSKKIEYIKVDLTNMDDCKKAVKDMDYVFMCAANTSGAAVIASTPLVHVTPNIIMNAQMLEASYNQGIKKFIWLSSNAAYPPSGNHAVSEKEMFDSDPYEMYFGVAWMKRYTEILCRMYSEKLKNPMVTVVLRPSNIYGPYDDFDFATSHVMAALIRRVAEKQIPLEVWGDGEDVRDWIYIDDFIDAMMLIVEKTETYLPVNVALGKGHSIKQALQIAIEIDKFMDAKVVYNPSKPSMIPIRLMDTWLAEKVFGFKAKTSLRDGIKKTLEWYHDNK